MLLLKSKKSNFFKFLNKLGCNDSRRLFLRSIETIFLVFLNIPCGKEDNMLLFKIKCIRFVEFSKTSPDKYSKLLFSKFILVIDFKIDNKLFDKCFKLFPDKLIRDKFLKLLNNPAGNVLKLLDSIDIILSEFKLLNVSSAIYSNSL